ncbi:RNA polymerase II transcription factor B subunit 4 [Magnaporthiopsis poae ATCC 64411]|uniref:General transcription and DNA repair factor IIH subunit TFB4 n=1 Tax=Magnaporthiopsis poae (strain ATCC 64411 / 73-15) TaxID=644358 RepID=A0A0C4E7A6_MAGP6|nr:RNA polymerase II transcription factor B subunit 4 [Magnaporthiopsis poae ATCC 64411]
MNAADAVDASEHYEVHTTEEIPSLLAVVVDTNPSAWALIRKVLPISKAIANILIYVNAHLALSNLNQVAIIAAHSHRARWLYPSPPNHRPRKDAAGDPGSSAIPAGAGNVGATTAVRGRILVVSVSDSSASQYIPTMNAVFAASHASVPLDVIALRGNAPFLQQGSYITGGNFIHAKEPRGLLTYLMAGFPVGGSAVSDMLISPGTEKVDFRAACFCHRKALDTGFVCSVCLSIFCEAPPANECLTCGSTLALGAYGARPAVVPRARKKKKRKGLNGDARDSTGTPAATPRPG